MHVATRGHYVLRAAGSDGVFETSPARGEITKFADDLVFQDGSFTQYPEGI